MSFHVTMVCVLRQRTAPLWHGFAGPHFEAKDIHLVMEMCSGGSLAQYIQQLGSNLKEDEGNS